MCLGVNTMAKAQAAAEFEIKVTRGLKMKPRKKYSAQEAWVLTINGNGLFDHDLPKDRFFKSLENAHAHGRLAEVGRP